MASRATIRISRRMYTDDVTALRRWLEKTYPGNWTLRDEQDDQRTLGVLDDILVGVFTGVGTTASETVRDAIASKIRSIVAHYRDRAAPDFDVSVETTDGDDRG
jgi:hypothetical protein